MQEAVTTDATNNNGYGKCDVVAVVVHNADIVKVPLPLILLLAGMLYVGEPPYTGSSTVPVETIVGGHMSNLEISHDVQDSITVQP